MDVSFQMVDRNQRLIQREGERLGKADAHQQSASQSRPLCDRDGIDGLIRLSRFGQRLPHHRNDGPQMLARSQLRNHSSIRPVRGDLRSDDIRENLFARTHHGRPRLVTGALDTEMCASGIISGGYQLSALSFVDDYL